MPPGKAELGADVKKQVADNKIMLFMKGNANAPRCGFSTRVVESLKKHGKPFGDKDVLENPQYRYAVSKISSWPTIPQIFIGGCDILTELDSSVELAKLIAKAYSE